MTQKSKDSSFLGDVQQSPINSSMPVRSTSKQLIMGLLALAVVAGLAYGGFRWYKMRHSIPPTVNTTINTSNSSNNTATSTDYSPNPGDMQLVKADVAWQTPQKTADLKFLPIQKSFSAQDIKDLKLKITYYKVGKFTSGPYKGWDLYDVYVPCNNVGCYPNALERLAVNGTRATVLTRYSDGDYDPGEYSIPDDDSLSIPSLDIPQTITSTDGKIKLTAGYTVPTGDFLDTTKLIKSFDSKELGPVYAEDLQHPIKDTPFTYAFYAAVGDGTTALFWYQPPFIDANSYNSAARVTWDKDGQNKAVYTFQKRTGCGGANYADVVTDVSKDNGLIPAGKTEQGDVVYEYSDSKTDYLKKLYNDDYSVGRDPKDLVSYDTFITKHPVFFWQDVFGRYIRFVSGDFLPLAECAKPVIYLYPPQTEKVSVGFGGGVTLTYTEPKYNNGWQVTAEPNGTLTNSDGKTYPYLFWEGRGLIYESPKQGFIVKREDLDTFLSQKLSQFGLIDKEIADFKQYWLPFMQDKSYYFVGFHTQNYLNKLIPENVTPKPDTVIRVLMDFNGLDKPIKVTEPKIFTPSRQGFTLVEWGGVRR